MSSIQTMLPAQIMSPAQTINAILIILFGIGSLVLLILWLLAIAKYNKLKNKDNQLEQTELDQRLNSVKWIGK